MGSEVPLTDSIHYLSWRRGTTCFCWVKSWPWNAQGAWSVWKEVFVAAVSSSESDKSGDENEAHKGEDKQVTWFNVDCLPVAATVTGGFETWFCLICNFIYTEHYTNKRPHMSKQAGLIMGEAYNNRILRGGVWWFP